MSTNNLYDLIRRLHRQFPINDRAPHAACEQCGAAAIGGDLCADCLVDEIEKITGDSYHPHRYRTQIALQQWHLREMVKNVERRMHEHDEEKKSRLCG